MLYQLHELHRAIMSPIAAFTDVGSKLFSHPASPLAYTMGARQVAAGYELIHRIGKKFEKPQWQLPTTDIDGESVAVAEETVLEKPFCNLVHFLRDLPAAKRAADPRVLLVAPMSGHHSTLLRDTVRALLPQHEIYVTDWIDARMVPLSAGPFHLADYVKYVQEFVRHLGPDVHVISVCQPTVPVLAAISLMASANESCLPRSMAMAVKSLMGS